MGCGRFIRFVAWAILFFSRRFGFICLLSCLVKGVLTADGNCCSLLSKLITSDMLVTKCHNSHNYSLSPLITYSFYLLRSKAVQKVLIVGNDINEYISVEHICFMGLISLWEFDTLLSTMITECHNSYKDSQSSLAGLF